MWFLRCPGCTPKVLSNDSIICWGVIDGAAAGAAVCAPANIEVVETVADARVRNINRVPRRTIDDFIKGHSRVAKRIARPRLASRSSLRRFLLNLGS
jgi:hypothetical protein